MFCEKFETLEEAQSKYPVKECSYCKYNIFESGINECSKISDEVLSKGGDNDDYPGM